MFPYIPEYQYENVNCCIGEIQNNVNIRFYLLYTMASSDQFAYISPVA